MPGTSLLDGVRAVGSGLGGGGTLLSSGHFLGLASQSQSGLYLGQAPGFCGTHWPGQVEVGSFSIHKCCSS